MLTAINILILLSVLLVDITVDRPIGRVIDAVRRHLGRH